MFVVLHSPLDLLISEIELGLHLSHELVVHGPRRIVAVKVLVFWLS